MVCEKCGSYRIGCKDSRESITYPGRRRRRKKCKDCGETWATIEITLEEYEELLSNKPTATNNPSAAKYRARVVGMLLAMKKETEGAQRAAAEELLRRILRIEG